MSIENPSLALSRWLPLALLFGPRLAHCAEDAPGIAGTIGQMMFGLGLVLALMFGALLLIKKLSLPRGPAASSLKVVGAAAVGPRERVVLVEVGDKLLVLGVAPGQVEGLHTFDAATFPRPEPGDMTPAGPGSFAERVRQVLERRS